MVFAKVINYASTGQIESRQLKMQLVNNRGNDSDCKCDSTELMCDVEFCAGGYYQCSTGCQPDGAHAND